VVEPESAEPGRGDHRYYEGGFETRFRAEIARQADRFGWDEEIAQFESSWRSPGMRRSLVLRIYCSRPAALAAA